jgi:hypothetical protein
MSSPSNHNLGAGCLIVFAIPFAAIGTGALVSFARGLVRGGEMPVVLGIVGMVFSLVGYGMIVGALMGRKRGQREDELRARHPGQPWLWKEEWASRRIHDSNRTNTVFLWVLAVFWNAVSWPVLLVLPRELEQQNWVVLVAAIFPVAGVILIGGAIRATMRAMRFNRSTLVLDQVPVSIGGMLRGHVEVPYEPLAEASSIIVRLTAINRVRSGKSTTESIAVQEEREVLRGSVSRMPDGVSIPIAIDVPYDGPETQTEGNAQSRWRLTVDAEVPGIDYSASFDVPVFRTELSMARADAPSLPPPEPRAPVDYVTKQTLAGRELYFGRFRARGMAVFMFFFSLLWTAIVGVLFVVDAPIIITLVFAFFDVLIVGIALDMFFGSTTVLLGRDKVVVRHTLFRTKETVLRRDEIASAKATMGSQAGGRPYYDVEVRTAGGKKVHAGRYIRSKREAEWVASQIRGAMDSPS